MFDLFLAAIPATECAHVVVPEATEQAMRFYHTGNILWIIQQAWALIVPLLFLVSGFTGKLEKFSEKWGKKWFFSLSIYLVLFIAIFQLLNLPLDFYSSYIRGHEYGYATQSVGLWFEHYGKGIFVTVVSALAFVWIFYLLLKKSPRKWWIYGSIASIVIVFFLGFVQPIWIDPLFNQFEPMKDKQLEEQILQLASRSGIEKGRVFEVDKSAETTMINAYVIGFGSTNRIVLWDTAISQLTPNQILFVMGHEMGHYVLHHMWWNMLYLSVLTFIIFYLLHRSADALLRRYKGKFGFRHLSDIGSLPLLLFLLSFFLLLSSPLSNYISRVMEHQADQFGLEITQNNEAAGEAFVVLQQKNLGNPYPGPIYTLWRETHPSLGHRIDYTNSYCPWSQGEPLKYEHLFK